MSDSQVWEENVAKGEKLIREAAAKGAQVILLQELIHLSGIHSRSVVLDKNYQILSLMLRTDQQLFILSAHVSKTMRNRIFDDRLQTDPRKLILQRLFRNLIIIRHI